MFLRTYWCVAASDDEAGRKPEDVAVFEAQQANLDLIPNPPQAGINGGLRGRTRGR
jgi:hypothetical protein